MNPNSKFFHVFLVLAASIICTAHGRTLLGQNNVLSGNQLAVPLLSGGGQSNNPTFGGEHGGDGNNIVSGNQAAIPVLSGGGQSNNPTFSGGYGGNQNNIVTRNQVDLPILSQGGQTNYPKFGGEGSHFEQPIFP